MPNVKMPDGVVVAFPDTMPPEQIKALILKKFPDAGNGGVATPPPGLVRGSREYADWAAQTARSGQALPQVSQHSQQQPVSPRMPSYDPLNNVPLLGPIFQGMSMLDQKFGSNDPNYQPSSMGETWDRVNTFGNSLASNIPIVGPSLQSFGENVDAGFNSLISDKTVTPEDRRSVNEADAARYPTAYVGGAVAGNMLPLGAIGATEKGAKLLGLTGNWFQKIAATFGSTYALEVADKIARGEPLDKAAQDALGISEWAAAIPAVGATVKGVAHVAPKVFDWATGDIFKTAKAARNPTAAAENLVTKAYASDVAGGTAMGQSLDDAALAAGQPIVNLDRGGVVSRELARTASNLSAEAKATLEGVTARNPVSSRVSDFLTRIVGGSADDLALREGLRKTAKMVNAPAYKAAYAAPRAADIYTPRIQQLAQAPEFQQAIKEAESAGKTSAARFGGSPPPMPFRFDANGTLIATPVSKPSLEFWDNVQQSLRRQIESLGHKERSKLADLTDLRTTLLGELDSAVPQFQAARQGAAKFFGAEDALDAGRNFANARGQVPEATQAFSKFSEPEKKAFAVGWASSLVDKLGTKDSYAIVKQTFESPNAREMAKMVLGPAKAAQFEAFLKVEQIMQFGSDALRGNSSTARQLAMMGAVGVGAGGYGAATGDWKPLTVATLLTAGRYGLRNMAQKTDQKVMMEVAKLLASGSKADLAKVTANAALSPKWKAAVDAVFSGLPLAIRGTVMASPLAAQPQAQGAY